MEVASITAAYIWRHLLQVVNTEAAVDCQPGDKQKANILKDLVSLLIYKSLAVHSDALV